MDFPEKMKMEKRQWAFAKQLLESLGFNMRFSPWGFNDERMKESEMINSLVNKPLTRDELLSFKENILNTFNDTQIMIDVYGRERPPLSEKLVTFQVGIDTKDNFTLFGKERKSFITGIDKIYNSQAIYYLHAYEVINDVLCPWICIDFQKYVRLVLEKRIIYHEGIIYHKGFREIVIWTPYSELINAKLSIGYDLSGF